MRRELNEHILPRGVKVIRFLDRSDLAPRYAALYRDTKDPIEKARLPAPTGERVSLARLSPVEVKTAPRRSIARRIPGM